MPTDTKTKKRVRKREKREERDREHEARSERGNSSISNSSFEKLQREKFQNRNANQFLERESFAAPQSSVQQFRDIRKVTSSLSLDASLNLDFLSSVPQAPIKKVRLLMFSLLNLSLSLS